MSAARHLEPINIPIRQRDNISVIVGHGTRIELFPESNFVKLDSDCFSSWAAEFLVFWKGVILVRLYLLLGRGIMDKQVLC